MSYIVVSFMNATIVLSIGETVVEVGSSVASVVTCVLCCLAFVAARVRFAIWSFHQCSLHCIFEWRGSAVVPLFLSADLSVACASNGSGERLWRAGRDVDAQHVAARGKLAAPGAPLDCVLTGA